MKLIRHRQTLDDFTHMQIQINKTKKDKNKIVFNRREGEGQCAGGMKLYGERWKLDLGVTNNVYIYRF